LPAVDYFSVSSDNVPPNSIVILVWSVSGADSASIDNGIGNVAVKGRYALLPLASTTYILTATSAAGSVTAQTIVEVSDPAAVSGYRPSYTIPRVQQSTVVGSPFTIKLEAQPSQGYTWVVDYYDQTMLSLVSSDYQAYGPPPRGSDGQQQFTFQPLKGGNTRILVSNVTEQNPTKFDSVIYDINVKGN
jgi:predicted secreted protein